MTDFQKEIHSILEELEFTLVRKNIDYGNSFDKSLNKWGLPIGAVRIEDKLNRLEQLLNPNHEQQVSDEALEDTVLDLAGYSILLYRYLLNNKEKNELSKKLFNTEPNEHVVKALKGELIIPISDLPDKQF